MEINPRNGDVISDTGYTPPSGISLSRGQALAMGPDDKLYAVLGDNRNTHYHFLAKLNGISGAWEVIDKSPAFQATPSGYLKVWGMCFGPPIKDKALYFTSSSHSSGETPDTFWACLL